MLSGFAYVYVILYLLGFSASNNLYCYRHCGCPACVCVYVRSFLPSRASRPPKYRYVRVHRDTENSLYVYLAIIIMIFAENASLRSYGRRLFLSYS